MGAGSSILQGEPARDGWGSGPGGGGALSRLAGQRPVGIERYDWDTLTTVEFRVGTWGQECGRCLE